MSKGGRAQVPESGIPLRTKCQNARLKAEVGEHTMEIEFLNEKVAALVAGFHLM